MRDSKDHDASVNLELGKINLAYEECVARGDENGRVTEGRGNGEAQTGVGIVRNNIMTCLAVKVGLVGLPGVLLFQGAAEGAAAAAAAAAPRWNNGTEFLMSCIAMSVGLGNIWRFPYTAFENGRGAFLICYLIVLTFIGRPLYYLELAMGQFTSKGCIHVWECVPLLRGIGYGQTIASSMTATYYCALMAITLFYLVASFSSELPWTKCQPEWDNCFNATSSAYVNSTGFMSSSELYFLKEVLKDKGSIDDGIGAPEWRLACCLLITWIILFLLMVKGVQSSGRAAYFLAIFPYIVLLTLMVRGCTLPGAVNGILFFVMPDWRELLNPKVWYAAVTQAFFSLGVCFGTLVTYSSYNDFRHNIHRDTMIVTVIDTFTSVIAGITTFSILGNLAHELGTTDVAEVTRGGIGLAFISYPEAISKFEYVPQFFAVTFFFMLYVLGAGSAVSYLSLIVKIFTDRFPGVKNWSVSLAASAILFLVGLTYVTPGGKYVINLVDYYVASFNIFIIAGVEVIGVSWIYGYGRICKDLRFMLGTEAGIYWKLCWGLFAPVTITAILVYTLAQAAPLKDGDYVYPVAATVAGWILLAFEFLQIPGWAAWEVLSREGSLWQRFVAALKPSSLWGPYDPILKKEWEDANSSDKDREAS